MAAFVLAKCRFPGSKIINSIIVVALLYQSNVIYIMQYMVMAKLNMIDSYLALILPSIASPMGSFSYETIYKSGSRRYDRGG